MAKKKKQKFIGTTKLRHHVKLTFVPHKANQYRPHLVRYYGIIAVLLLVVGVQAAYNFSSSGSVLGAKESISTVDLLSDTNAQRADHHLPALRANGELSQAAFLKAKDMFAQQYWAHVAPNGTTPWHWFAIENYNYSYAGENLAKNFTTADATMVAWMGSPEHRANILDPHYTDVGFAVVDGTLDSEPTTLVVALYGAPAAAVAAASTATQPTIQAPVAHTIGPLTRLGVALQSITPAAYAALAVLLVAAAVALAAHFYRHQLPKRLRQTWHRHHGLAKVGAMLSLCVVVLVLYSGGQI